MSLKIRTAAVAVALAALTGSAGVQAQAIKEGELANIKALKCTFPVSTVMVWKNGVPEPRIRTSGTLTIEINEIDAADGSAVVGQISTGNHDVNVQVYGWNMHFLEVSRGGRMGLTTVFAQYTTGSEAGAPCIGGGASRSLEDTILAFLGSEAFRSR